MKNSKQNYNEFIVRFQDAFVDDNRTFELKKQVLLQQSKSSNTGMAIYAMQKDEYNFLHWMFNDAGVTEPKILTMSLLADMIHPDDVDYAIESKMKVLDMLKKIPVEDIRDYKLIFECRLKDVMGIYHRFIHQFMVLELNKDGDPGLLRLQLDRACRVRR